MRSAPHDASQVLHVEHAGEMIVGIAKLHPFMTSRS